MPYESEKQAAITAVTLAAQLCENVRRYRLPSAIAKQDRSPVTVADFGAQAVICRVLARAFPSDAIVAEEDARLLQAPAMAEQLQQVTAQVQAVMPDASPDAVMDWIDRGNGQVGDRFWTLDPIDGTKGFVRGDQYAIALALIEAGHVQVGVMACPALPVDLSQPAAERGVLFVAVRGQGTQQIPLHRGYPQPIQVAHAPTADILRLVESMEAAHGNIELQQAIAQAIGLTTPALKMDSQAKYGIVAQGQAALYLRLPWVKQPEYRENIWDHAAGAIVVEEAGGRVTDMYGHALEFSVGPQLVRNQGIVASNGGLHPAVLSVLREKSLSLEEGPL